MSLTSYRTAPSRDTDFDGVPRASAAGGQSALRNLRIRLACSSEVGSEGARLSSQSAKTPKGPPLRDSPVDYVNGLFPALPPAAMPGDDLLFHTLRHSTIGAVWFHGRVRDGIGWVTDAMVTKQ